MVELKSPAEIESMRVTGGFVAEVLSELGHLRLIVSSRQYDAGVLHTASQLQFFKLRKTCFGNLFHCRCLAHRRHCVNTGVTRYDLTHFGIALKQRHRACRDFGFLQSFAQNLCGDR